jgi:hypothetical protein
MRKIYTLNTRFMNGTVTMMIDTASFSTIELAEEAADAVKSANEGCDFNIINDIKESVIYESREEVPILNQDKLCDPLP